MEITTIITIIASLIIGIVIGRYLLQRLFQKQEKEAREKAAEILKEAEQRAENHRKTKALEAKEKFLKLKSEHEKEVNKKNNWISQKENSIKQKEKSLSNKFESLNREKQELDGQRNKLSQLTELNEKHKRELDQLNARKIKQLESLAEMSAEDAKKQLIDSMTREARSQAMMHIKEIVDGAKMTASKEAKKIVIQTIQRTATETAIENTVSVFNIESDDVKGRVIGREGRNIRALEGATGIEIIVDDTPGAIILSGFDPVRREIARLSLHRLVTDGRIHPARIEEVVEKTKGQIEDEIIETGERTVIDRKSVV